MHQKASGGRGGKPSRKKKSKANKKSKAGSQRVEKDSGQENRDIREDDEQMDRREESRDEATQDVKMMEEKENENENESRDEHGSQERDARNCANDNMNVTNTEMTDLWNAQRADQTVIGGIEASTQCAGRREVWQGKQMRTGREQRRTRRMQ